MWRAGSEHELLAVQLLWEIGWVVSREIQPRIPSNLVICFWGIDPAKVRHSKLYLYIYMNGGPVHMRLFTQVETKNPSAAEWIDWDVHCFGEETEPRYIALADLELSI